MRDNEKQLGQRIVTARKFVDLTQHDLATETGLSSQTIQRIEHGERTASRLELVLIADACGALVEELLGTSTLANEVRCTRHREPGEKELADYLLYAFGVKRRLDQAGIPEPA